MEKMKTSEGRRGRKGDRHKEERGTRKKERTKKEIKKKEEKKRKVKEKKSWRKDKDGISSREEGRRIMWKGRQKENIKKGKS